MFEAIKNGVKHRVERIPEEIKAAQEAAAAQDGESYGYDLDDDEGENDEEDEDFLN